MKNLIYLVAGVIVLLFAQACRDKHAKNYNKTDLDQNGVLFIKNGIESGITEIKASGFAITNSNNQRVIGLAKMMIDDHTKAGDALKKLEEEKRVNETDTINSYHQKAIEDIAKQTGTAFDKGYIQMMVSDHEQAVRLFTTASQNTDGDIKSFAVSTLPTIQMHLDSAKAVLMSLK